MYNKVDANLNFVEREKNIEKFWRDNDIFQKSMDSRKEGETLMCVVDRKQFYEVKGIIDRWDRSAFVIASETKEVYGEGFMETLLDGEKAPGA